MLKVNRTNDITLWRYDRQRSSVDSDCWDAERGIASADNLSRLVCSSEDDKYGSEHRAGGVS